MDTQSGNQQLDLAPADAMGAEQRQRLVCQSRRTFHLAPHERCQSQVVERKAGDPGLLQRAPNRQPFGTVGLHLRGIA
jgi:hypothetical protein